MSHESTTGEDGSRVTAQLLVDGEHRTVTGEGNGPIAAFVAGLQADLGVELDVVDYSEHAVGAGSDAVAVAYVETQRPTTAPCGGESAATRASPRPRSGRWCPRSTASAPTATW